MLEFADMVILVLFGIQVIVGLARITMLGPESALYAFTTRCEWYVFAFAFILGIWIAGETAHAFVGSEKMSALAYPAIPCLPILVMIALERSLKEEA